MFRTLATAALLATLATGAAFADDAVDPAIEAQLRDQLTAEGYEIRSVQMEDGLYEVYALKDGERYELYFDETLAMVEHDDEDGED